jgi:hypothetical protein
MRRLWVRSIVAFLVMDTVLAGSFAVPVALGFRSGSEFGGVLGTAIFAAFVAVGYCAGALAGAILPMALLLRASGWAPNRAQALVVGAGLSLPAFAAVVIGAWLIDGAEATLVAYVRNVLRFPTSNVRMLSVFALGGAIVLSGLARRSRSSGLAPHQYV